MRKTQGLVERKAGWFDRTGHLDPAMTDPLVNQGDISDCSANGSKGNLELKMVMN